MEFKNLVEAAEKWCSGNPFDLIFAEEDDERRMDFYAEPGVSFYVLCPGGTDNFVSEPSAGPVCMFVCVFVCAWGLFWSSRLDIGMGKLRARIIRDDVISAITPIQPAEGIFPHSIIPCDNPLD